MSAPPRDYEAVKAGAQAIYRADSNSLAMAAFRSLQKHWQGTYPVMVRQLEKDLPELLSFFTFPRHLWRQLRTTNVIERCFVEVRRRTRPMVCFVNVESVDRIIYAIFNGFNEQWRDRTLRLFTQAALQLPISYLCRPWGGKVKCISTRRFPSRYFGICVC